MAAKKRYTYSRPRPMVTADAALFRLNGERIEILLVQRGKIPFKGAWVLPGGFVDIDEPLEAAAIREVAEETGIKNIPYLSAIGAYGEPDRDPRGRVITAAFTGILSEGARKPKAGDDAADARWFSIEALPALMGFDHPAIIGDALRKIATLGRTSGALFVFLKSKFTEADVARLLNALYGMPMNAADYMATFVEMGLVRSARKKGLYRFVEGERVRRTGRATQPVKPRKTAKKPTRKTAPKTVKKSAASKRATKKTPARSSQEKPRAKAGRAASSRKK